MKKINELLTVNGWKLLCRLTLDKTPLEVDPEAYGDTIARRIFAKYGNKPVNDQYDVYLDNEGDEEVLNVLSEDLALTYGDSWNRMYIALDAEYNPIENYDRTEATEVHDTGDRSDTYGQRIDTKGEQENTQGSQTITLGQHEDTHAHNKAAYDDSNYSHDTQDVDNYAQQQNTNGQRIDTEGQRQDTKGQQIDSGEHDNQILTDSHIHGNVGVTTNQQMINQEIDMRLRWKIVDIITRDIVNEMTLKCY